MAKAFKVALKIEQGATYDETWTWTTGDGSVGNPVVPIDLSGCTARAQFRESADSTTVLATLTTDNGRIILGTTTGTVRVLIDEPTTAAFAFAEAVYDLEIVHPSGKVRRLMEGAVAVSPNVTRPITP